jgi:hypothetical protein
MTQPMSSKSSVLWNISVNILDQGAISRLTSINHEVDVSTTEKSNQAHVTLSKNVDKSSVPHQDFVLMIRNDNVNKPAGLVAKWPDGDQAVAISIMPDFMTAKQRLEIKKQQGVNPQKIDTNPNIVY